MSNRDSEISQMSVFEIINEILSNILELDRSLQLILDYACNMTKAQKGVLLLLDQSKEKFEVKAVYGYAEDAFEDKYFFLDECIAGWVVNNKKSALIEDVDKDEYFCDIEHAEFENKNILSVPLMAKSNIIGVISFSDKSEGREFTITDLDVIEAFLGHVMFSLDTARAGRLEFLTILVLFTPAFWRR